MLWQVEAISAQERALAAGIAGLIGSLEGGDAGVAKLNRELQDPGLHVWPRSTTRRILEGRLRKARSQQQECLQDLRAACQQLHRLRGGEKALCVYAFTRSKNCKMVKDLS